jgi:hypothetical protein
MVLANPIDWNKAWNSARQMTAVRCMSALQRLRSVTKAFLSEGQGQTAVLGE